MQVLIWIVMRRISATRAFVNGVLIGPPSVTWDETGTITDVNEVHAHEAEFDAILVPGFIDLQINGFGSFNCSSIDVAQWSQVDDYLLSSGVTSWCPTIVSAPLRKLDASIAMIGTQIDARNSADGIATTSILGIHLEGPFLGTALGAHDQGSVVEIDLRWLEELPTFVTLMTIGAEQKEVLAAIRILKDKDITVSLGHTRATELQLLSAKQAGARMATHLYNAMSGVHHRDHGVALNILTDDDMFASIIVDLEHVSTRAVRLAFIAKSERIIMVSDSVQSKLDHAPRLKDGTLAGSVLTLDKAVRNAVFDCSVSLSQALNSVTRNPAEALGITDRGEIRIGTRADLVLLDDDLNVIKTISNGLSNSTQKD